MVDKTLRQAKERILIPIAQRMGGVDPSLITWLAFGVGVGAAVSLWQQNYGIGILLWGLNRILDGLDGTLARTNQRQSDFGGYLDMVLDVVIYTIIPLGLTAGTGTVTAYLALAVLLGSFYINAASWMYLAALLEKRQAGASSTGEQTTITMPTGLIEGTETIVLFSLFILLPHYLVPLFYLMAALVLITAIQRLIWAYRVLDGK